MRKGGVLQELDVLHEMDATRTFKAVANILSTTLGDTVTRLLSCKQPVGYKGTRWPERPQIKKCGALGHLSRVVA